MKKSLTSLVLAVFMVMSLCIPASASDASPETPKLTRIENIDFSAAAKRNDGDAATVNAIPRGHNDAAPAYEIRNTVSVQEVHIIPAILCIDTGSVYTIDNLEQSRYWTSSQASQYASLELSVAQVDGLHEKILNVIQYQASQTGQSWGFIGWFVTGKIVLTASWPLRVEYIARNNKANQQFEKKTLEATSQSSVLNVEQLFYLPSDFSQYYYIGFSGNFYYNLATGTESGTNFTCGVSLNNT